MWKILAIIMLAAVFFSGIRAWRDVSASHQACVPCEECNK